MIQQERLQPLNAVESMGGRYVLYWMQASQRAECNHALEYAARQADAVDLPLVVVFGLTDDYPEANTRHYTFMLEGLRETGQALRDRGIQLVVLRDAPDSAALKLAPDAALLVADRGYLRLQRRWRQSVARHAPCSVTQVESDVVVPVDCVSDKEEYAARTIRPKLHRTLEPFMRPLDERGPRRSSLEMSFDGLDISDPARVVDGLEVDPSVGALTTYRGGAAQARKLLRRFIDEKLDEYDDMRNEPGLDYVSHMSPYLHFGQISPLQVALAVREAGSPGEEAYLEELIVRRELSMNFVYRNESYGSYDGLPDWARRTLSEHAKDPRPVIYTREQLEAAQTGDPYWNAAQQEMVRTGKMHNYMRMYWGKQILQWSAGPQEAFETALYLNNKYELDGRDANSYTGVAWCFGKHDRPWKERAIFGKVRYMNAAGLERKFDMDRYVAKVRALT